MYQDKLAHLKKQLQQLEEGTLPEYIKKRKKIDQQYKERIRVNEIWREFEVWFICVIAKWCYNDYGELPCNFRNKRTQIIFAPSLW